MAAELGDRFRLDVALTEGLVPLVWSSDQPEEVLKAYVGLYLKEEVQMEGLVRRIDGFARFLEAVSFSHAAVLNVSEVARECQVSRKTVEGYLEILEDLLLAFQVPVFSKRAQRHLTSRRSGRTIPRRSCAWCMAERRRSWWTASGVCRARASFED